MRGVDRLLRILGWFAQIFIKPATQITPTARDQQRRGGRGSSR